MQGSGVLPLAGCVTVARADVQPIVRDKCKGACLGLGGCRLTETVLEASCKAVLN